jgi:hypothetical protein
MLSACMGTFLTTCIFIIPTQIGSATVHGHRNSVLRQYHSLAKYCTTWGYHLWGSTQNRSAISWYFSQQILARVVQCLARLRYSQLVLTAIGAVLVIEALVRIVLEKYLKSEEMSWVFPTSGGHKLFTNQQGADSGEPELDGILNPQLHACDAVAKLQRWQEAQPCTSTLSSLLTAASRAA